MSEEEKIRRLKSGKFHMQVRDPLNPAKRISITEQTRAQVLARAEHYRRMRGDLHHGLVSKQEMQQRRVQRADLKLRDVWTEYVESFDVSRRRAMAGLWKSHFATWEKLLVCELTAERWADWEKWEGTRTLRRGKKVLRGLGTKTIKVLFAQMRAAVYRKLSTKIITEIPWGDWQPRGNWGRQRDEREALRSIDEVAGLLHVVRQEDEKLRSRGFYSDYYTRVAVFAFCGLRQAEMVALGWDDIEDLQGEEIAVEGGMTLRRVVTMRVRFQAKSHWQEDHPEWARPRYPPKKGSVGVQRLHAVPTRALDEQRAYLRAHHMYAPDGPVFPDPKTGTWRRDDAVLKPERLREFATAAGLKVDLVRLVPHGLRHTMTTLEMAAGGDLVATQQRLRHKNSATTMQYMHAAGRGLPRSPLPDLPDVTPPNAPHLVEPPPVLAVTAEAGRDIEEELRDAEALQFLADPERSGRRVDDADASDLERHYHAWIEGGRRTVRPAAVTEGAERARTRVYVATVRALQAQGTSPEEAKREAREKGKRAKFAYLGAWGRIARRLGEPAPVRKAAPRELGEGGGVVVPFRRKKGA